VAVETGIAPRFLMEDELMLRTMIDVINERNEEARRAANR
jgi:hypothetical protein